MKSGERGAILITAILFISLMSLLVLSQMQLVLLQLKAANQMRERHKQFYELEQSASKLIQGKFPEKCIISGDHPNQVVQRVKRGEGCKFNGDVYLFERLGIIPCLNSEIDGVRLGTLHWRLTIAAQGERPLVLQIRMAHAAPCVPCTRHIESFINTGITSWNVLE